MGAFDYFENDDRSTSQSEPIQRKSKDPTEMDENELILCSPTGPGFSYGQDLVTRSNAELTCSVAELDIKDINWSSTAAQFWRSPKNTSWH